MQPRCHPRGVVVRNLHAGAQPQTEHELIVMENAIEQATPVPRSELVNKIQGKGAEQP